MQEHRDEQEGTKMYPCKHCNLVFHKLPLLREHMKQHYKIRCEPLQRNRLETLKNCFKYEYFVKRWKILCHLEGNRLRVHFVSFSEYLYTMYENRIEDTLYIWDR